MDLQVRNDLIRDLQIRFRTQAGIPEYNSDSSSLPLLPSIEEAIANFDSSPPYLRCKHCKGRLLTGVQSVACIYCGRQHGTVVDHEPLKFKSTVGYRWLLESLNMDASETVGPPIETNEINRDKNIYNDELSLSDLLDSEIKWISEIERVEAGCSDERSAQSKNSINVAGVDLDNFFSAIKNNSVLNVFEVHSKDHNTFEGHANLNPFENFQPSVGAVKSTEDASGDQFQRQESLDFFENFQSSNAALRSTQDEGGDNFEENKDTGLFGNLHSSSTAVRSEKCVSDDRFSGWESEFLYANSGALSSDDFGGSVSSVPIDTLFCSRNNSIDEKWKDDSDIPASMANDSGQDDIWSNFVSGSSSSNQAKEPTVSSNDKDGIPLAKGSCFAMHTDCNQDVRWQTSGTGSTDSDIVGEDDNFDAWNDFTTSSSAQDPVGSSLKQTGNHLMHSAELITEIDSSSSTNKMQGTVLDNFTWLDSFSAALNSQGDSRGVDNMQAEATVSDRIGNMNAGDGVISGRAPQGRGFSDAITMSKNRDMETLISQMHDLTFMLESNLSIPKR